MATAPQLESSWAIGPSGSKLQEPDHLQFDAGPLTAQLVSWPGKPEQVLFGALHDPMLRVRKPIPARIRQYESEMVAVWDAVDEFGQGESISAALDDLGHTISELYHSLNRDQQRLGSDMSRIWSVLKEYIEETSKPR